ncbi:hypothetical protein QNK12_28625 [Neobacillus cucumis]|nr:hypothetical protein QNK12_28625 [Neobacillus cucumis]
MTSSKIIPNYWLRSRGENEPNGTGSKMKKLAKNKTFIASFFSKVKKV